MRKPPIQKLRLLQPAKPTFGFEKEADFRKTQRSCKREASRTLWLRLGSSCGPRKKGVRVRKDFGLWVGLSDAEFSLGGQVKGMTSQVLSPISPLLFSVFSPTWRFFFPPGPLLFRHRRRAAVPQREEGLHPQLRSAEPVTRARLLGVGGG